MATRTNGKTKSASGAAKSSAKASAKTSLPVAQEAYYVTLGLLDWAVDHVVRAPKYFWRFEKELLERGQTRHVVLSKQVNTARRNVAERGKRLQATSRARVKAVRSQAAAAAKAAGRTVQAAVATPAHA